MATVIKTRPKIGLMTFGDERDYMWEGYFGGLTMPRHEEARTYLASLPLEVIAFDEVARSKQEVDGQVKALKAAGAEALFAHTPCWCTPNIVVRAVQSMELPTVIMTSKSAATHGMVGMFAAAGALSQVGVHHIRIRDDFGASVFEEKMLPYFRAASVKARLRGRVMGLFGGRSLGIDTGTFDPMQWRSQFGVDVDHIDQLEIVRRADLIEPDRAEKTTDWMKQQFASINFDGGKLTEEKLNFQARCYLATKDINEEKGLDFISVKCMTELSDHYVPQCISAALMPGPYDAEGAKQPCSMSCEADGDGALSMEILKDVSGGGSTLFADVSHMDVDKKILYLPNCGGMCSWFAGRSDKSEENLGKIELRPSVRPGGGAITYFTAAPGPITLARLYRVSGQYRMAIIPGDVVNLTDEDQAAFIQQRGKHQLPTAFVKVEADLDHLVDEFGSNHISGVAGIWTRELEILCEMLDIEAVVMDGSF
ncbi:MAG: L-fucose isomerase [Xanthomonadales bacterium]|jgi:L-fucose isomerase|nr:L-fucose isomerase [Xanthomonadales bacterium]